MKISGEFEVKLNPIESYAEGKEGIKLNRMSINKTFVLVTVLRSVKPYGGSASN